MISLVLSVAGLAVLAALLPFGFSWLLPEGTVWLVVNGLLSALVLLAVAMGYFIVAYAVAAPGPVTRLIGASPGAAGHFLRLGLMSAIIWLPVLVLALAAQPGRWKEKVW